MLKLQNLYILHMLYNIYYFNPTIAIYSFIAFYNTKVHNFKYKSILNHLMTNGFSFDSRNLSHIDFHDALIKMIMTNVVSILLNQMILDESYLRMFFIYQICCYVLNILENITFIICNQIIICVYLDKSESNSSESESTYSFSYKFFNSKINNFILSNNLTNTIIRYIPIINAITIKMFEKRIIGNHFINKKEEIVLNESEDCTICLEPITKCYELSCNHKFHAKCILEWCEHSDLCPLCKQYIG